jgi:pyruvate dehydrogenase (quinone)
VLVLHNDDLTQVSWEMREAGDPKYLTSQDVGSMDYAGYAELLGFTGIRVDRPEDVAGAWDAALRADRPVLLDVITDPDVPPLPAHISLDEAKGFVESLLKGDPSSAAMTVGSLRAVAGQMFGKAKHAISRDD